MKTNEQIAEHFAQIMIEKMKNMKEQNGSWEEPWFTNKTAMFWPQNYSGRKYNSGNAIMLLIISDLHDYKVPIFLTFKQCQEIGVHVKRGEKSEMVYYRNWIFIHKETKEKLDLQAFRDRKVPKDELEDWVRIGFIKTFNVFNLDQTNFEEVYPEKYKELTSPVKPEDYVTKAAYTYESIDALIENKKWHCPITTREQDRAYYLPDADKIYMPLKVQFPVQNRFYSTVLHEIAHSTGHHTRLNRDLTGSFGSPSYAKEELVAELTSAFVCTALGITQEPSDEAAIYLNSWIKALKNDPKIVFKLMDQVMQASSMILEATEAVEKAKSKKKVAVSS